MKDEKLVTVTLAFYKAKGEFVDKVIRWRTNSVYSHCELIYNNEWYSSSPRDGGVRKKSIEFNSDTWDTLNVDVNLERLLSTYEKYKGRGYDYLGIMLSNAISLRLHSNSKATCSEFLAEILDLKEPQKHTPKSLFNTVKNLTNI